MASSQGSMSGSFEFSSYIDEEQHCVDELAEKSSAITTPANPSVNKEGTATKSHQTINHPMDDDKSSAAAHEAPSQREFRESEGTVTNGRTVLQTPDESSECAEEPVKRLPIQSPQERNCSASSPSGIDPEGLINTKHAQLTPPTSTIPTSSYSLRNRTRSKLVYDVKYHPMDDAIRPSQAAKRRSAHGEIPVVGSDDSSDVSTIFHTDAASQESSDAESKEEEKMSKQSKKPQERKQIKARLLPAEGTRRSKRKVSDQKTSYNMDVHPQDKYLVISSDDEEMPIPSNKRRKRTRKRPNAEDDSESDNEVAKRSQTSGQTQSRRTDPGTSDSIDSRDAPVYRSVENGNDTKHTIASTASSHLSLINNSPGYGIRRREGMDVWHYPPGKRYLKHDRDYWPTLPNLPFEIFHERLEDQLAREAMEASPLNHEHDNKENLSNAGLESLSDDYGGISVMPSAQYHQSSQERQSANHRALVSDALYSDEAPQSYGLDGTHGICEVQRDAQTECMEILVSGGHLPPGPTNVETQTELPDSVLDSDFISDIRGSEL